MIEPCEEVKRVEQRYEKALDDMEKHYKDILEQIRAEIEQIANEEQKHDGNWAIGLRYAVKIIDKYIAERADNGN